LRRISGRADEARLHTTASGYLKQPDKHESPYRECLGPPPFCLGQSPRTWAKSLPIKASDKAGPIAGRWLLLMLREQPARRAASATTHFGWVELWRTRQQVLFGPQRFRGRDHACPERRNEGRDQRREPEREYGRQDHPRIVRIQSVKLAAQEAPSCQS
jgi:hypothetical protein